MGVGPWALGELLRDVEKTERARFRRQLDKLQAKIWAELDLAKTDGIDADQVRHVVANAFLEARKNVTPKKKER